MSGILSAYRNLALSVVRIHHIQIGFLSTKTITPITGTHERITIIEGHIRFRFFAQLNRKNFKGIAFPIDVILCKNRRVNFGRINRHIAEIARNIVREFQFPGNQLTGQFKVAANFHCPCSKPGTHETCIFPVIPKNILLRIKHQVAGIVFIRYSSELVPISKLPKGSICGLSRIKRIAKVVYFLSRFCNIPFHRCFIKLQPFLYVRNNYLHVIGRAIKIISFSRINSSYLSTRRHQDIQNLSCTTTNPKTINIFIKSPIFIFLHRIRRYMNKGHLILVIACQIYRTFPNS